MSIIGKSYAFTEYGAVNYRIKYGEKHTTALLKAKVFQVVKILDSDNKNSGRIVGLRNVLGEDIKVDMEKPIFFRGNEINEFFREVFVLEDLKSVNPKDLYRIIPELLEEFKSRDKQNPVIADILKGLFQINLNEKGNVEKLLTQCGGVVHGWDNPPSPTFISRSDSKFFEKVPESEFPKYGVYPLKISNEKSEIKHVPDIASRYTENKDLQKLTRNEIIFELGSISAIASDEIALRLKTLITKL